MLHAHAVVQGLRRVVQEQEDERHNVLLGQLRPHGLDCLLLGYRNSAVGKIIFKVDLETCTSTLTKSRRLNLVLTKY